MPTYRIDVGNMATTEPTSPVDEMLAMVMYVADSTSTTVELLLQYSSKPQQPDVNRPYTGMAPGVDYGHCLEYEERKRGEMDNI